MPCLWKIVLTCLLVVALLLVVLGVRMAARGPIDLYVLDRYVVLTLGWVLLLLVLICVAAFGVWKIALYR